MTFNINPIESESPLTARSGAPVMEIADSDFLLEEHQMTTLNDLTGQRFGRLEVKGRAENIGKRAAWLCICDCGGSKITIGHSLRHGITRSCGCLATEMKRERATRHGMSLHPLHNVWNSMIQRCTNPNVKTYPHYGGRGISVCNEWMIFEGFRDWALSAGYKNGLTIERTRNGDGYSPENCSWVTKRRQANNRRSSRNISYKNRVRTITEWSREVGIPAIAIWKRLDRGWSVERALETPIKKRRG